MASHTPPSQCYTTPALSAAPTRSHYGCGPQLTSRREFLTLRVFYCFTKHLPAIRNCGCNANTRHGIGRTVGIRRLWRCRRGRWCRSGFMPHLPQTSKHLQGIHEKGVARGRAVREARGSKDVQGTSSSGTPAAIRLWNVARVSMAGNLGSFSRENCSLVGRAPSLRRASA